MELGITNPLQKFLKLKQPPYGTCPDPLFFGTFTVSRSLTARF